MPGRIEWDNAEKTILLQIYEGHMILDDYYLTTDAVFDALKSQPHIVDVIMVRDKVKSLPSTFAKVLQYANRKTTDNLGINVIVGATGFTRFLVRLAKTIAPKLAREVYFADSLEEARRIIREKASKRAQIS